MKLKMNIKDNGDKINKSDLYLNAKVQGLKKGERRNSSNIGDIKSNMEKLNASWAAIASKMQSTENNNQSKKQEGESKTSSEKKLHQH